MKTNYRALCIELLDCLGKADWPCRYKTVFQQWVDYARVALSEPELPETLDEIRAMLRQSDQAPCTQRQTMVNYENMSHEAKVVFVTADLFGDGGKEYNASFAAIILRTITDLIVPEHRENHPNTLDERYRKISAFNLRNQLLAIAAELSPTKQEED
jgi:hypothetical protein